jgi:hypothetical protein
LCRDLELPSLVLPPGPLTQYAAAAHLAGAQALLLGDCLEDRAAVVFASILLDGKLASLPFGQPVGDLIVGRPLGAVMHQRLLEAGVDMETPAAFDDRATRATDRRLALLEDYLSFMPGSRLDLLTNIAQSPDRVQDGYLT